MKKIIVIALLIIGASIAISAQADFSPAVWEYKKPIQVSGITEKTFVEVTFDGQVFEHAKPDGSDIRVLRGDKETPFVRTTEAPQTTREVTPVTIVNQGFIRGSFSTFIADLGASGILHNRIAIKTNTKNFTREVEVQGSPDNKEWFVLEPRGRIYNMTIEATRTSPSATIQNTSIPYPETTYRYLRIRMFDNGEDPLTIYGAEVAREYTVAAREVSYQGTLSQEEKKEVQQSILTIDAGAKGLPTNKIVLETPSTNFKREVGIEGSNDNQNWSLIIFRDVLFSYDTPKFKGSKLILNYPETNFRYLRLTIFNKDDQPIQITKATLAGYLRKLVFEYTPGAQYYLYYGAASARHPEYDLQNYIQYLDISERKIATLGLEEKNQEFEAIQEPQKPFTERYPGLLLAVLVIAVLALGGVALRLFWYQAPPQAPKQEDAPAPPREV